MPQGAPVARCALGSCGGRGTGRDHRSRDPETQEGKPRRIMLAAAAGCIAAWLHCTGVAAWLLVNDPWLGLLI
jgi:hypothetical protein